MHFIDLVHDHLPPICLFYFLNGFVIFKLNTTYLLYFRMHVKHAQTSSKKKKNNNNNNNNNKIEEHPFLSYGKWGKLYRAKN